MKKNLMTWCIIIVLATGLYSFLYEGIKMGGYENYSFSDFLDKVSNKEIESVILQGHYIEGKLTDGKSFNSYAPDYPNLVEVLQQNNVRIDAMPLSTKTSSLLSVLISWFPIILLIGVWMFFMKQMQQGGGKAMGFGKSKAKLMQDAGKKVMFKDVAGIDEAKEELTEIVDFLKDPQRFQRLGAKIPKGCLLVGHPGTGKTLLAKAIAGEANVPFFSISGSDFVEMFVGVGASRVRDMFEQAKKSAPCIIFIDEIDAVGRHRGIGLGGGNDEREQTLNQLLVEMDGFEENEGIIIIAATNRPDVLDPALLRPGRFDRQVEVSLPDLKGRESILKVHLHKIKYASSVDPLVIARGTPGFSGADLANIINESALIAARRDKRLVTMNELEEAKDKVMMGTERKSLTMRDEERKLTAYHEGGHAIIALNCPASDPIHKATIIPRGRALGMVMRLPEHDRVSMTREKIEADLAVSMGGRVAEEIIFGYDKITSGASSDIKHATGLARAMVTEWGMSDEVGPIFYGGNKNDAYLNGGSTANKDKSGEVSNLIESEIKKIIDAAYKRATKILTDNIEKLHMLADALLKYETLSGDEIKKLLRGENIDKKDNDDDAKGKKSSLGDIDFGLGNNVQEA